MDLKKDLIALIGGLLDEECFKHENSFIEMDHAVIHYVGDRGTKYFKVTLEEVDEDEYFKPYVP